MGRFLTLLPRSYDHLNYKVITKSRLLNNSRLYVYLNDKFCTHK